MSMIATAVKHMLAAGMPAEAIVAAVAEMEAALATGRSKHAEAQARYRERKASQVITRDHADHNDPGDQPPHPPETRVSPVPPSQTHTPRSGPKGPSLPPSERVLDGAREVAVRKAIVAAFDAVGKLPPSMHLVAAWLARGYSPELIEDVVCTGIRNGRADNLAYFEKVLPDAFAQVTARPRPPPDPSEPATVTVLNTRKRHDQQPSIIDIGRHIADNPPPGYT
ncbi:hypothetical protein [Phreatobacter oligotrophus]|uniref:Uncharacterized protein n=1 Tax=Phreatobacter oligotrophus TaxID=1122261 RepID=A0A2T4ZIS7_9HYPH|nr:hypothetical protein [Phreatobacter oligotrophus]PTM61886.1 hypothetical protein C8P69_101558 [Phreatobacter oligotrophus]